jgi:hypothetical protein
MGTVEAALASGLETARILLGKNVAAEHNPAARRPGSRDEGKALRP